MLKAVPRGLSPVLLHGNREWQLVTLLSNSPIIGGVDASSRCTALCQARFASSENGKGRDNDCKSKHKTVADRKVLNDAMRNHPSRGQYFYQALRTTPSAVNSSSNIDTPALAGRADAGGPRYQDKERAYSTRKTDQERGLEAKEGYQNDPESLDRDAAHHFRRHITSVTSEQSKSNNQKSATVSRKGNSAAVEAMHSLPHPVWSSEAVHSVEITHHQPERLADHLALLAVRCCRFGYDVLSGYAFGFMDERHWLNRIVFLETVAGVPGMVGAMTRHLTSLRKMQRDYGWIHTLLEEAENERMHLMTALVLKRPSQMFRLGVLLVQGTFLTGFGISYLISSRFAHRFVGYLEEEAVKTYTHLLAEIDAGKLPLFEGLPAPAVAKIYWGLSDTASFRDVILAIRADESHHREVNHTFAGMRPDEFNPFPPGH